MNLISEQISSEVIFIDLSFTHDLELLDLLQEFNIEANEITAKVLTSTNTISAHTRQVQIQIDLGDDFGCNFDKVHNIIYMMTKLDQNCQIEQVNFFLGYPRS